MSEAAAFAIVCEIRERIMTYGSAHFSQERLDDLLSFCGLPGWNDRLVSMAQIERVSPEIPSTCVYVLAHEQGDIPMVKVGVSRSPDKRCVEVARGRGARLYVAAVTERYTRTEALRIERQAHASLAGCSTGGEWFACPAHVAFKAVLAAGGSVGDII